MALANLQRRFEATGELDGEPKLHFRRTKKFFGFAQTPYEHMVIPYEALTKKNQELIDKIKYSRLGRGATTALVNSMLVGGGVFTNSNISLMKKIFVAGGCGVALPLAGTAFKEQRKIKDDFLEKTGKGRFSAKAALVFEGGKYVELRPSQAKEKYLRMTHFVVDNAGNVVLLRHPTHEVPKRLAFRDFIKSLKARIMWEQPMQRIKTELHPPTRLAKQPAKKTPARSSLTLNLKPTQ